MKVHHRFLRRPYHIILENFNTSIGFFETLLDRDLVMDRQDLVSTEIIDQTKIEIHDNIEDNWVRKGIPDGDKPLFLQYQRMPMITHGQVTKVCAIIELSIRHLEDPENPEILEEELETNATKFTQNQVNNALIKKPVKKGVYKFPFGSIEMDYDRAVAIIELAKKIIDDKSLQNVDDERDLKWLEHLRVSLQTENKSQKTNKEKKQDRSFYKSLTDKSDKFWKTSYPLKKFNDTRWLCFQRTDGCNTVSDYSVSISPIELRYHKSDFGMSAHMASQYMNVKGEPENYNYNGIVTCDSSTDYMVVELIRDGKDDDTPTSLAYFIMQLNTDDRHQSLCMGHYIYYSLNSKRFITKTVIWVKAENTKISELLGAIKSEPLTNDNFLTYAQDINPENPAIFNKIPLNIRRFLADRKLNRLTLPDKRIAHLDETDASLAKWMQKVNLYSEDRRLTDCQGDYYIMYYYGGEINDETSNEQILQQIRVDTLKIKFEENYVEYRAEYIHERSPQVIYKGKVARRKETLEVIVENKRDYKHKDTSTNIVLVNFTIPDVEENLFAEEYSKVNYLEGIITGLNDNELTPISFIATLAKIKYDAEDNAILPFNKHQPTQQNSIDVASFFRNNSNQLKIEALAHYPFSWEDIQYMIFQKGYGCFELDGEMLINDFAGNNYFRTPVINTLEYTIMQNADRIKRLPNIRNKNKQKRTDVNSPDENGNDIKPE